MTVTRRRRLPTARFVIRPRLWPSTAIAAPTCGRASITARMPRKVAEPLFPDVAGDPDIDRWGEAELTRAPGRPAPRRPRSGCCHRCRARPAYRPCARPQSESSRGKHGVGVAGEQQGGFAGRAGNPRQQHSRAQSIVTSTQAETLVRVRNERGPLRLVVGWRRERRQRPLPVRRWARQSGPPPPKPGPRARKVGQPTNAPGIWIRPTGGGHHVPDGEVCRQYTPGASMVPVWPRACRPWTRQRHRT